MTVGVDKGRNQEPALSIELLPGLPIPSETDDISILDIYIRRKKLLVVDIYNLHILDFQISIRTACRCIDKGLYRLQIHISLLLA